MKIKWLDILTREIKVFLFSRSILEGESLLKMISGDRDITKDDFLDRGFAADNSREREITRGEFLEKRTY